MEHFEPQNTITMAETKVLNPDELIEELKAKREKLSRSSAGWQEIGDLLSGDPDKDRDAALSRINELLELIKTEINLYWGPGIDEKNELRLLISDKQTNPWRKQVEDIEGDVDRIVGI
jgi:hypothetical protein